MGGGGGFVENATRAVAAAATGGLSEVALEHTGEGRKTKKKLGFTGEGGGVYTIATPGGLVSEGKTQVDNLKEAQKQGEEAMKSLQGRQEKLFKQQQEAIRQDQLREERTRRRAKAQAQKRLALGIMGGKTGTVKTGALGLQNPASIARRFLG